MNLFTTELSFKHIGLIKSVVICLFMATFYVLSLYLWSKQNRFNRNEPSVIRRRFISVTLTCILCTGVLYMIATQNTGHLITEWIGLKIGRGLLTACFCSILGTILLFSGPILQHFVSDYLYGLNFQSYEPENTKLQSSKLDEYIKYVKFHFGDLCFWRNYIISPFTEEFVFRGCMLPLLVQNLTHTQSILIAPLFFGLAHLHHIAEGYFVNNQPLKYLLIQHLFQFSYTYVFGTYSSYLFLRTGNLFASVVCHSICNCLGFPNFRQLLSEFRPLIKYGIISVYVLGLVSFFVLIPSLTEPSMFGNQTYLW